MQTWQVPCVAWLQSRRNAVNQTLLEISVFVNYVLSGTSARHPIKTGPYSCIKPKTNHIWQNTAWGWSLTDQSEPGNHSTSEPGKSMHDYACQWCQMRYTFPLCFPSISELFAHPLRFWLFKVQHQIFVLKNIWKNQSKWLETKFSIELWCKKYQLLNDNFVYFAKWSAQHDLAKNVLLVK